MTEAQRKFIEELYFSLFELLLCYAGSALGNAALAEEAVQETFRIACTKPDSLCTSPNPRGWLVNTLKNVICNMEKRRAVAGKIVTDSLGDQTDALGASEDQPPLELLYGKLANTEEFRLMSAIALDGKSMSELAGELGISINACKKRAQRAREMLRKKIKNCLT